MGTKLEIQKLQFKFDEFENKNSPLNLFTEMSENSNAHEHLPV